MTTINRNLTSNSTSSANSSANTISIQETSLLNAFAFISNFEDLLKKIIDEAASQQSTITGLNTLSDKNESAAETVPGSPEGVPGQSSSKNTMSLTQALKDMLMTNANSQSLIAQLQATAAQGQSGMMQQQLQQLTTTLSSLQNQIQAEQDAENHRSFWQKFTDGITKAINAAWDFEKKTINGYAQLIDNVLSKVSGKDVHAAEAVAHFAEDQVEKEVQGIEDGVQWIGDQIHYVMEDLAKGLAWAITEAVTLGGTVDIPIDQDKLQLACTCVIAAAILVAVTFATMGTGTAETASVEGAGLAAEGAADAEQGVEMADLGGGIRDIDGGADAIAGAGDAGAASDAASAASWGSKLNTFLQSNAWSLRIFATTYYLQESDFAQDVAKQCTDDPAVQAVIANSINAGLSMASAAAGFTAASSLVDSGNGLYSMMNKAQMLNQLAQFPGDVGTMKWDFRLANISNEMGDIQSDFDKIDGLTQSTQSAMSQSEEWFGSFMKSLSDNITKIANIMPMASQGEADALSESHSA